MTNPSQYSIRDLEALSGIKAHTIRIWEKRYQIFDPQRTQTNIRFYSTSELKKLLNISLLIEKGHKISKISCLNHEHLSLKVTEAFVEQNSESDYYKSQINTLLFSMFDLDEPLFDKTFSSCVLRYGLENTIHHVVYPLLKKVGIMWCVNEVNPAQEHFVSNLVRQKILSAIDGIAFPNKTDRENTYVLFLPENEDHELGLILANYILKKAGKKVIYLGAKVPFADLKEIVRIADPGNLFTFFITPRPQEDFRNYLNQLKMEFQDSRILFAGNENLLQAFRNLQGFHYIQNTEALSKFLIEQ